MAKRRSNFLAINIRDESQDFIRTYKDDISRGVTRDITRFVDNVTPRLEQLYSAAAPKKSGRLSRSITARARRTGHAGEWEITVGANVARGRTHFNYLPVTRFGHRRIRIYPKRAKMLRFRAQGRLIFANSVKGYRPRRDWVQFPTKAAREIIDSEAARIGDTLTARPGIRGQSMKGRGATHAG